MSDFFHIAETALVGLLFGGLGGFLGSRRREVPPESPGEFPPEGLLILESGTEEEGDYGRVLVGSTEEEKLAKLASDVVDGVRSRARQGIVRPAKIRSAESEYSLTFTILLPEQRKEICYRRTFAAETWEIAKIAFEDIGWYHTLIEHLIDEAITQMTFQLERS